MRFWEKDIEDINKVKRIKFHKPIHDILNVKINNQTNMMVVYEDATTESLDLALESRIDAKKENKEEMKGSGIASPQLNNGTFSFVKKVGTDRYFCFTTIDTASLTTHNNLLRTLKLERSGQNVKLMGYTVIPGQTNDSSKRF
jgi:hypothetical protein